MAKFTALSLDDAPALERDPYVTSASGVEWSKQLSPDDYSLRLVVSQLDEAARLEWDTHHGDEALCVLEGELVVDSRVCPTGGAVVIESGVAAVAVARGATRVAHYAPSDPAPPADGVRGAADPSNHGVHVVGDKGWFASQGYDDFRATYWTDSTCPTCRIAVFRVEHFGTADPDVPHHHSQDEIIFLTEGALRMGARVYPAGTALSIPANMRYSLRNAGGSFTFLNYRRDASMFFAAGDAEPKHETGLSWGVEVADFR